ncbi:response regulator transcription factor [Algoriphagus halophytocola]|uniref:Response regulator transcription factor n=1 Tax=Algoriphagus halophytocola TaxID=2991499 RepID=A0ABY6MGG0_9BACT|nr:MULTISPECIES: response regulator transcription factor [unclassified Algoriphagus]UZD22887.1 response regulator transcription factor [Algoriphagus sp. TR-M5]WBL44154.1 response regulator transcription factor [Algoriphagus sp. TR-M9]
MSSKTKILLVEDNQSLSDNVKEMLTIQGYEVSEVLDNADNAYSRIEKNVPDAILLDIQLKGTKTGINLAEELRNSLMVPIIFMTSSSGKDIVEKVCHVKPDGFITKPFSTENLVTSIELAIQNFKHSKIESTIPHNVGEKYASELFIRESGWLKKIVIKNILWIKAEGAYTKIVVKGKQFTLRNTTKEVMEKLPEEQFVRVHKSYIINIKNIEAFSSTTIKISDSEIPIGRNYYAKLISSINRFSN